MKSCCSLLLLITVICVQLCDMTATGTEEEVCYQDPIMIFSLVSRRLHPLKSAQCRGFHSPLRDADDIFRADMRVT